MPATVQLVGSIESNRRRIERLAVNWPEHRTVEIEKAWISMGVEKLCAFGRSEASFETLMRVRGKKCGWAKTKSLMGGQGSCMTIKDEPGHGLARLLNITSNYITRQTLAASFW